ncbi:MAG: ABC transporter substrate-binding protein [Pseudomonadota bacterium]
MKTLTSAICAVVLAVPAALAETCADGKTLTPGTLTIATGNPAYYPWVHNDAPESKEGFEAAVAYAVAAAMGFSEDKVVWVRTSFDEAIQPGAKNFDFNMQQYSITEEREKMVDFSAPYYSSAMAVLTTEAAVERGVSADPAALRSAIWGAVATTTAVPVLTETIKPEKAPLLYGDTADVTAALQAGQIDAALFDLPTALYLSAVVVEGGTIIGQYPASRAETPDQFGMLMEEGNPLKECVDAALAELTTSGKLAEIEATWLQDATGVPVID